MGTLTRILHIDDNRFDRELIQESLDETKFHISAVQTRSDLEKMLDRQDFDVVLSDFNILGLTGLEVIDIVVKNCPGLPVILVTGTGSEEIAVEALKKGAADYVIKSPSHIRRLPNAIDAVLDKKRTHQSLLESQRRYQEVVENTEDLITQVDGNGTLLYVNNTAKTIYGLDPSECIGLSAFSFILEADRKKTEEHFHHFVIQRALKGTFENRLVSQTGEIYDVSWVSNFHYDSSGQVTKIDSIGRNITDRKKSEDRIRKWAQVFEHAQWGIAIYDCESFIIGMNNPSFAKMHDYDSKGLIGISVTEIIAAEERDRVVRFLENAHHQGHCTIETKHIQKDGTQFPTLSVVTAVKNDHGKLLYFVENLLDMTERKRVEEERERLVSVVENAFDGIGIVNLEGQVVYLNRAGQRMCGFENLDEVRKTKFVDNFPKEEHKLILQKLLPSLRERGSWKGELLFQHSKTGAVIPAQSDCFTIYDPETNVPMNFVIMARDLTERKKLESELRQAQKMEAIGTLAGGIAHDFNNILAAIFGYGELAQDYLPEDSEGFQYIQDVLAAGQRAKELVKQILTFSRLSEQELRPLKVQVVVREAIKLLRSSIPTTIDIKSSIDPDCGAVLADPTQVHQIVMNLCTNAYHAMREEGGTLAVTLRTVELNNETLGIKIGLHPGTYVRLEISDTGCGIKKEHLEKIFDPYFTTKAQEEGTGLGLAVVHGIVRNFGGDISVYSEIGVGTTFSVFLPVTMGERERMSPENSSPLPRGSETILVVDDDESLTQIYKEILEGLGYRVSLFSNSLDALDTFQRAPYGFDLILTDMTMPRMTGLELSKNILSIRSNIPIILLTGFSELVNEKKAKEIGIRDFIMKPVLKRDLARSVRDILDEK